MIRRWAVPVALLVVLTGCTGGSPLAHSAPKPSGAPLPTGQVMYVPYDGGFPMPNCTPNLTPCVEVARHTFNWLNHRHVAVIDGHMYIGRGPHCGWSIENLHPRLVLVPDSGFWFGPPDWCRSRGVRARLMAGRMSFLAETVNPFDPPRAYLLL